MEYFLEIGDLNFANFFSGSSKFHKLFATTHNTFLYFLLSFKFSIKFSIKNFGNTIYFIKFFIFTSFDNI